MRIYLCGQKHFGHAVLSMLMEFGHSIAGVSSPAWRNEKLRLAGDDGSQAPDRLRQLAQSEGIAWQEAGKLRAETLPASVDLILAAHSHDYLGAKTRAASRFGAIGYHPSLLPVHRGRDAIRWAIRLREPVTGGTVFWLNDRVDAGPVAAQDWCFIRPGDSPESLWRRELQPMGIRLLAHVLKQIGAGQIVEVPQDETLATWEPSFDPPRLRRPDLPQLGSIRNGAAVVSDPEELRRGYAEMRLAMYS